MKWYDKKPTTWLSRWLHHRWFRSWNQHEEMGGGSHWLWLTRPTIYNTKGDHEFTYGAIIFGVPVVMIILNQVWQWLLINY